MTELQERLAQLAAVADTAPNQDTARRARERARRYRRRRRVGTTVVVATCAVMLVAIAGVARSRAADPAPARSDVVASLPDRLYRPSPWLPGTSDSGPLGPLAAVVDAERGSWTGGHPGVVGVAATSGDYRFLDLPDAELLESTALSPDGRYVAYWTTGHTKGSPNRDPGPVAGVAVYDSVTGRVVRHSIGTEHGLAPDVLMWAGRRQLVFGYGQWLGGEGDPLMKQSSAKYGPRFVWDLDGSPRRLPVRSGTDIVAAGPGHVLAADYSAGSEEGAFDEIDLETGHRTRLELGNDMSTPPVLDDSGRLVAVVAGLTRNPRVSGRNPNAVRAGAVTGTVPRVPHSGQSFAVLGWVDPLHVAAHQRAGSPSAYTLRTAINSVDIRDGSKHRIMSLPDLARPQIAVDLLGLPSRPAVAPARPIDPRLFAGAVVLSLALAVFGIVAWRRRVRP